ncbi:hypothetical protein HBB16_03040 [Pseudonocardia sp. MCCB 268]|nr:hypothetical protein [Pseudonocardia cytotoxica]
MTRAAGGTVALSMTSQEDGGGPPSTVRIVCREPPHCGVLAVEISEETGAPWELAGRARTGRRRDGAGVRAGSGFSRPTRDQAGTGTSTGSPATLSSEPMPDWEATLAATRPHYATGWHRGNACPRTPPGTSASERSPNPVTLARSAQAWPGSVWQISGNLVGERRPVAQLSAPGAHGDTDTVAARDRAEPAPHRGQAAPARP